MDEEIWSPVLSQTTYERIVTGQPTLAMSDLRTAVHVSKPAFTKYSSGALWSTILSTLLRSEQEAMSVDVPTTIRATRV